MESLEARERDDERGLKEGLCGAEVGPRWLGRREAGENDLLIGGGGDPEGVEFDDKRSSHMFRRPALGRNGGPLLDICCLFKSE